jgi:hypothetical protein
MKICRRCKGTGVIETGNNDLPCDCPAGDKHMFNSAWHDQPVSGKELREHPYGLNKTPEEVVDMEVQRLEICARPEWTYGPEHLEAVRQEIAKIFDTPDFKALDDETITRFKKRLGLIKEDDSNEQRGQGEAAELHQDSG